MSAKIDKIILEVGGKKMALSPDEAKELKGMLNELYGEQETKFILQPYPVDHWRYTKMFLN